MTDTTTVLTARGQASIPARIRKQAGLEAGDQLVWEQTSESELRIRWARPSQVGVFGMLGYARKYHAKDRRSTDEILRDLREGE
ncbi:MAG: AbrB/MazE/SpoVT family DNA-binding domain-containing protein [Terrimicrobiaceae bacterium]